MAFANYSSVLVALSDPDFQLSSFDDVAMMISKRGEIFELNLLGAFVWELMNQAKTINVILDEIVQMFNVERSVAYQDLEKLIGDMIAIDVISCVNL
jgi:hypothetical protein